MPQVPATRSVSRAVRELHRGGIIAYPTETVWGIGCDPNNLDAVERLLAIKQRDPAKGLILLAAHVSQLAEFLPPLANSTIGKLLKPATQPTTWVIPANLSTHSLIRGQHDTLAMRITSRPQVSQLCRQFGGAIISTSANPSSESVANNALDIQRSLPQLDLILSGSGRSSGQSSRIVTACDGNVIRAINP